METWHVQRARPRPGLARRTVLLVTASAAALGSVVAALAFLFRKIIT